MDWYGLLILYIEKFGKLPSREIFKDKNLGKWCSHQRASYNKKTLSLKKVNLLEKYQYGNGHLNQRLCHF